MRRARSAARKKETHGELPVGFRGEKQPSRDGAADSEIIDRVGSLCGRPQRPLAFLFSDLEEISSAAIEQTKLKFYPLLSGWLASFSPIPETLNSCEKYASG